MKRLFLLSFLSLAFLCLSAPTLQAEQQGEIYGWGETKLLNGQTLSNISKIAAGSSHSLALKADGSIVGWGYNSSGQAEPPVGNDFITIAAGGAHSLALKPDGSIVGWGHNWDGQATPPEGEDFTAITAGGLHSLALKADGSIVGWGDNEYGQATPPDGDDFIAIVAGWYHSLALKADGSIIGWGYNDYGQATPPDGNDFIAVAAGAYHSLALKKDGSIIGWGRNDYGQATSPDGNDFIAIAAGENNSLALRAPVQAQIKLTPQMLSCDSHGNWLKAHVIMPEEIYPEDIDVNTPAVADPPGIESEFIEVNEYSDGYFDVQIYFDRDSFCGALSESEDDFLEVTVTGSFIDGRKFQGSDTIKLKTQIWQHRIREDISRERTLKPKKTKR